MAQVNGFTVRRQSRRERFRTRYADVLPSFKIKPKRPGAVIADEAASRLLDLELGRGDAKTLRDLVVENENRPYHGALEGKLLRARQAVWLLDHTGAQNIVCGPRALNAVLDSQNIDFDPIRLDKVTGDYIATGLPMTEVVNFAAKMGWPAHIVRRIDPAAPIPTPSVLHAKEGHYALLQVDDSGGQYFLEDRGLGFAGWVSREAVDQMSSGSFVVAKGVLPRGYAMLHAKEGARLFGRDGAHGTGETDQSSDDPSTTGCGGASGMARYTLLPQLAAVRLMDTLLGYSPPFGPDVSFTLTYNELDSRSPESPPHANMGRLWTLNWVAWIEPPSGTLVNGSQLRLHRGSGGTRVLLYDAGKRQFGPHDRHFTTAKKLSSSGYEVLFPDGSREVYDLPNNPTNVALIYMTRRYDPQGNLLTFDYDSRLRLTKVTDATGQQTTLLYEQPSDELKITRVRDPFGREASLAYNTAGELLSVTDVIGLPSSFTYSIKGTAIEKLRTPYGDTRFTRTVGGSSWNRTVEVTDPKGDKKRVQYVEPGDQVLTINPPPRNFLVGGEPVEFFAEDSRLQYRNSYYWTKIAMATAPGDVKAARNYRE